MDCYRARTLLGAYLDGEIVDWDVVREIEVHVADGRACAEDALALRELITAIRERAPYYKAPKDLASKIMARVRQRGN